MPQNAMGYPWAATAGRLHHWVAALESLLLWIFSLGAVQAVFPCWDLRSGHHPPPCSGRPNAASVPARLIKEGLRVSTFGEVAGTGRRAAAGGRRGEAETCAVCLGELRRRDRVRVPRNCRHVYHRRCLDRWIDHDGQGTCPLCRAPLLEAAAGARTAAPPARPSQRDQRCSWAAEQMLYLFGDDLLPDVTRPSPSS